MLRSTIIVIALCVTLAACGQSDRSGLSDFWKQYDQTHNNGD